MNRVTLQPTVFINHPRGDKTYGYRMYDDYGQTYCNLWESIPDDDLEIVRLALEDGDDIAQSMFGFILEHGYGLYIGGEWYGWDKIKHLFQE